MISNQVKKQLASECDVSIPIENLILQCPDSKLQVISGATHLFEEPGALEEVARIAAGWFETHLGRPEKSLTKRSAER